MPAIKLTLLGNDHPSIAETLESLALIQKTQGIEHSDVTFKERITNDNGIYDVYHGPSRCNALRFLRLMPVMQEGVYLVVETPEGNVGKDLISIFNENTGENIEFGERKPLSQITPSMTHCAKCGYTVLPGGLGLPDSVGLEQLKQQGVGYYCSVCKTAWCPFCVDADRPFACDICGTNMDIYRKYD